MGGTSIEEWEHNKIKQLLSSYHLTSDNTVFQMDINKVGANINVHEIIFDFISSRLTS